MLLQNYLFMSLVRLQDCRCHQKENFRAFIEIDDSWGEGEGLAFQQGSKDAAPSEPSLVPAAAAYRPLERGLLPQKS